MKKIAYLWFLFLCLFVGCVEDTILYKTTEVSVSGSDCMGFLLASRNAASTSIPDGSVISFYAEGGIEADGIELSLHGNRWKSQHVLMWHSGSQPATVATYYPPLKTNNISFYDAQGFLTDYLFCVQKVTWGQSIRLSFRHLFAKLQITLPQELNSLAEEILFVPSHRVTGINILSGNVLCEENPKKEVRIPARNSSSIYEVLIPPVPGFTVEMKIKTKAGKSYSTLLTPRNLAPNKLFRYKLSLKDNGTGIFSTEEFIDFLRLLSGRKVEGRTLDSFGQMENERMVYRLKSDIVFTEAHRAICREENLFGYPNEKEWRDVFDGEHHTIYHPAMAVGDINNAGLFPIIGKDGVVRNLHVEDCTIELLDAGVRSIGVFSGDNYGGLINDCSVKNLTISLNKNVTGKPEAIGSITGRNSGTIVNCSAMNIDFKAIHMVNYLGGLTGVNKGKLLNNSITTFHSKEQRKDIINYVGFFAGYNDADVIAACYGHDIGGHRICSDKTALSHLCFTPNPPRYFRKKGTAGAPMVFPYTEATKEIVTEKLNEWIDANAEKYPSLTFLRWESAPDTRPARHVGRK